MKKAGGFFPEGTIPENTDEAWRGMPEFIQGDLTPLRTIYVHFGSTEDIKAFSRLVGQAISPNTKFIWFPKSEKKLCTVEKEYVNINKP